MGTTACKEYSVLFKGFVSQLGYNKVALVEEYKRGLSKKLCEKIYGPALMPMNLAEWMDKACMINKQFLIGCVYTAAQTPSSLTSSSRSKPAEK